MNAVRTLLQQLKRGRDRYWAEHPEDWKRQEERICPLCGEVKRGYPFVWWHVPASEEISSLQQIGDIPLLACPDCYGVFRVQTELLQKAPLQVLLQQLQDRNWRLWLMQLERTGYQEYTLVGGEEGRSAFVIQLYAREWLPGDQPPSSTFCPTPTYLIAIPDAQSAFEEVNVYNILTGYTFARIVRGQDELRAFLRLGPQQWRAQQDEALLTVEQATEHLQVAAVTVYEYCRNFSEYGSTSQPPEEKEQTVPLRKRTSIRKLFHYRTSQGDIRIPPWAVELFLMQYDKSRAIHTLSTTRNDVRLLFGDQEPYTAWRGDKGAERITWLPRFELQSAAGGKRVRGSRVLVGITEIPRSGAPRREFMREYLDAHPCPPEEAWLIEEIKQVGGPVMYDLAPDEYWTFRSHMEYERLLYQEEEAAEDVGAQG